MDESNHQLRELLLGVRAEGQQASKRDGLFAVLGGYQHLGAPQDSEAVEVLKRVRPAGPQPRDQGIGARLNQVADSSAWGGSAGGDGAKPIKRLGRGAAPVLGSRRWLCTSGRKRAATILRSH